MAVYQTVGSVALATEPRGEMTIFLSYAREDLEAAQAIRRCLDMSRRTTWMDVKLDGGQEWWDEIVDQIEACSAFAFVLSQHSLASLSLPNGALVRPRARPARGPSHGEPDERREHSTAIGKQADSHLHAR